MSRATGYRWLTKAKQQLELPPARRGRTSDQSVTSHGETSANESTGEHEEAEEEEFELWPPIRTMRKVFSTGTREEAEARIMKGLTLDDIENVDYIIEFFQRVKRLIK